MPEITTAPAGRPPAGPRFSVTRSRRGAPRSRRRGCSQPSRGSQGPRKQAAPCPPRRLLPGLLGEGSRRSCRNFGGQGNPPPGGPIPPDARAPTATSHLRAGRAQSAAVNPSGERGESRSGATCCRHRHRQRRAQSRGFAPPSRRGERGQSPSHPQPSPSRPPPGFEVPAAPDETHRAGPGRAGAAAPRGSPRRPRVPAAAPRVVPRRLRPARPKPVSFPLWVFFVLCWLVVFLFLSSFEAPPPALGAQPPPGGLGFALRAPRPPGSPMSFPDGFALRAAETERKCAHFASRMYSDLLVVVPESQESS